MNGFKIVIVIIVLFLMNSCTNRFIKSFNGSALFIIYKFFPKNDQYELEIWSSPREFIKNQSDKTKNSLHEYFLLNLEKKYLVLRYGEKISKKDTYINKIDYFNKGAKIIIDLNKVSVENKRQSDKGYLILIPDNGIRNIILQENNQTIFITNIQYNNISSDKKILLSFT